MLKSRLGAALPLKAFSTNPFLQFKRWLNYAIQKKLKDANAMVLATVDKKGAPDSRVVLLKGIKGNCFIFFTNYNSPKAKQAERSGKVALNFYWPSLGRQIRIKGKIRRAERSISNKYFASRPRASQINTLASAQSQVIESRNILINHVNEISERYKGKEIPRPAYWGGFFVEPTEFEFFQGVEHRLNQRLRYRKIGKKWLREELSP